MAIMHQSLPNVQPFLHATGLKARARGFLLRLMVAFCCHQGPMSATQAATLSRTDPRHPAAIGRGLGRQFWAKPRWLLSLQLLLITSEREAQGQFFFLIDQTCSSRQGTKTANTFSTGNRQRRPKKGRRYQKKKHAAKRCHAFVIGLLITPNGVRIPYRKSYYTKEYAQEKGVPYRTQAQLGADLIAELPDFLKGRVVVLGDTAYEACVVHKACAARDFTWITPCNTERVFAGAKPRPKVRSLLADLKPEQFFATQVHPDTDPYAKQRRWSASRRDRRNRRKAGRTYWVCKLIREIHSIGKVAIVVSTTRKPRNGEALHEPKILLSSDVDLATREVVRRYTLRWQIELFFKEMKSGLGMVSYRFTKFERVERWVDMALATFMYLEWYRDRQRRRVKDEKKQRWWAAQRTTGILRVVRHRAEIHELEWLAERLRTPGGTRRVQRLLHKALPKDVRDVS